MPLNMLLIEDCDIAAKKQFKPGGNIQLDKGNERSDIQITYCREWGFLNLATSMAAAIESNFGQKVQLIEGHNGVFTVNVNGRGIFDKKMSVSFQR